MEIVDPRPWLEREYQRQLAELLVEFGEPQTAADRFRLAAAKRRLRKRVFAGLPPSGTASW